MRYKLFSFLSIVSAIVIGALFNAPLTCAAVDVTLPSGSLVSGYEIKNLSVIKDAFDKTGGFELHQTFSNCGYFAWVTHDISVTDTMGNQGSFDYDDFVVVCLFCPENASSQAEIGNYQGDQYFGIPDSTSKANPFSPPHWRVVIGRIKGSDNNQYVEYSRPLETFNYDDHWSFPLNSTDKPPLYYNFPSLLYGIPSDFSGQGDIPSFGTIDSVSDAGLLAEMYDITFTPKKIMPANSYFPLLNQELAVAPIAVVDDTGYNLISLQVPQLGYYTDVIVFGDYKFTPRDVSKYSFDKLKLSFGVDKLNTNDEEYTGDITNEDFACTFAGWDLDEKTLTVNHLSFIFNTKIQNYSNLELAVFDFSTNTKGSYPAGTFSSIGSTNLQSAGSFCYNFDFEAVNDVQNQTPLTPEDLDDLSDRGKTRTRRTVTQFGYVPREFSANTVDVDFGDWQPRSFDFSAANGLLSILLNDFVIDIILACVSIGIVGFILYGKQ